MRQFQHFQCYTQPGQVGETKLPAGQYYIYVIQNDVKTEGGLQHNLKIGITTHARYRMRQLSGSNTGGNPISRIAVSEPTYLYTIESLAHQHFTAYRIPGTEWFHGDDLTFDDVVTYLDELFASEEYRLCNQVREAYTAKHGPQRSVKERTEDETKSSSSY